MKKVQCILLLAAMFSSLSISEPVFKAPVACKQVYRLLHWLVLVVVLFQLRNSNVNNIIAFEDVNFCFEMLHLHDPQWRSLDAEFHECQKAH
jgi:hypothetical protein